MRKLLQILLFITLSVFVSGFSDIKQSDEYSCGPVCAANCAINILNKNFEKEELVQIFTKLAKTDKNGTTIQNLCSALESFFLKTRLRTNIKYYGIRKVERKYISYRALNICNELQKGSSVILNLGFYKKENDLYKRIDGHYVNAYACDGKNILIADPYSKDEKPFYISLEKINRKKVKNNKDNEKYTRKKYDYYKVTPNFSYQKEYETIILNGIISVYPLYL